MYIRRKCYSDDEIEYQEGDIAADYVPAKNRFIPASGYAGGLVGGALLSNSVYNDLDKPITEEEAKLYKKLVDSNPKKATESHFLGKRYLNKYGPRSSEGRVAAITKELGHDYYLNNEKGGAGKAVHKVYKALGGDIGTTGLGLAGGISAGILSGKKAAKAEDEGRKESKLNRHSTWAVPLAISAIPLSAEILASRKGLNILKESGASKELIEATKKTLNKNIGTYASAALANAAMGEGARSIVLGDHRLKKAKEKADKKDYR